MRRLALRSHVTPELRIPHWRSYQSPILAEFSTSGVRKFVIVTVQSEQCV